MLQLTIPLSPEGWDEVKQEFVEPKTKTIQLEHSLVSLAKWESKWCKAFLSKREKTPEETLDYIRCMTITQNVHPDVYNHLTQENINQIHDYIDAPMTAVYFPKEEGKGRSRETVTAELIYYWMISLNIPQDYQKWHLNRLINLIRVCSMKNAPPKKMSGRERARYYSQLNDARRKELNSRG